MRISDWSSDVCSSDLPPPATREVSARSLAKAGRLHGQHHQAAPSFERTPCRSRRARRGGTLGSRLHALCPIWPVHPRSEEHTSELQSLMRISYAVFCLKKKNSYNT